MDMENLRNMPFEALVGTVEAHPWFGAAQRVLCERTSLMGGRDLARDMYFVAALQVASRRIITRMLQPNAVWETNKTLRDYAFRGVPGGQIPASEKAAPQEESGAGVRTETILPVGEEGETAETVVSESVNKNYRGAGDYFSREQYEQVKRRAKEAAEKEAVHPSDMGSFNLDRDVSLDGFCTEALAEIYAEQGYFERAKDIYAKLILAEPEKNTYFASLIEKLNEKK